MPLLDALNDEHARRRGPVCSVSGILAALNDDDRAALLAAFASTQPSSAISRALATECNVSVSSTTLSRHRRGECTCG